MTRPQQALSTALCLAALYASPFAASAQPSALPPTAPRAEQDAAPSSAPGAEPSAEPSAASRPNALRLDLGLGAGSSKGMSLGLSLAIDRRVVDFLSIGGWVGLASGASIDFGGGDGPDEYQITSVAAEVVLHVVRRVVHLDLQARAGVGALRREHGTSSWSGGGATLGGGARLGVFLGTFDLGLFVDVQSGFPFSDQDPVHAMLLGISLGTVFGAPS